MNKEEKDLLLKDLSARLPFGVKLQLNNTSTIITLEDIDYEDGECTIWSKGWDYSLEVVRPYLRPMSSMTEEEKEEVRCFIQVVTDENYGDWFSPSAWQSMTEFNDYCNSHHLDQRGIIERGMAIAVTEDNNPYK